MDILYVIDRLELKYFENNDLVTNFTLIKTFLQRGHKVYITTIDLLKVKSQIAYSSCYETKFEKEELTYDKTSLADKKIQEFKLVMFRPDPPVDLDYINATYVFDFVERSNTLILNDTKAIRNFNEKMHTILFEDLMPRNIVTSSKTDILEFLEENKEIILKPLNQCFGGGVMYLKRGDKNTSVIINTMTGNEKKLIMVQKYIPEAIHGDKRVLFLGEEVLPYCIQKIPSNNDFKFCEHNDKNFKKAELTETERKSFIPVAKRLTEMGIYMAGLDVIDGKIIEINVTSPCYFIREINNHYNCHLEDIVSNYILNLAKSYPKQ